MCQISTNFTHSRWFWSPVAWSWAVAEESTPHCPIPCQMARRGWCRCPSGGPFHGWKKSLMLWDGFNNMWFEMISRWFWPSVRQKPKAFASLLMTLLASYCLPNPSQLYIPYPTPVQQYSSSLLSSCLHFVFRLLRQVIPQEQQPRPGLRCDDVAKILQVLQVAQNGTAKGDGTPQLLRARPKSGTKQYGK